MDRKKNTGYNIVKNLPEGGDINFLLEKASNRENSWLEFKGDAFYREEQRSSPKETQDDYSWNILKAVIAFANTCGGCVLIGLDDNSNPVPLRNKDGGKTVNMDRYLRDLQAVLFEKGKFKICHQDEKNPNKVTIELDCKKLIKLIELRPVRFKEENLIAILVKESEEQFLVKQDKTEVLYIRDTHGPGESVPLKQHSEIESYWKERPEITVLKSPSPQEYYKKTEDNDPFVGRVDELEALHKSLTAVPKKIPIVCGEAGIGKTELVKQYSRNYAPEYQTVIKLEAAGKKNIPEIIQLILGDSACVEKYHLSPCKEDNSVGTCCKNILQKLAKSEDEILICIDDLTATSILSNSEVHEYFRDKDNIHICATSRITSWAVNDADPVSLLKISGLPAADGKKLLEKKFPAANDNELKALKELVEYFDGNAWTLDLIGEILKQSSPSNTYTQMLKNIKNSPLKEIADGKLIKKVKISHHCNNFKKILDVSMDTICEAADGDTIREAADGIASLAAMDDPNDIRLDFIKKVFPVCYRKFKSDNEFDDAVKTLQEWNIFIEVEDKKRATMSRFTQFALRQRMGDNYYELRKTLLKELLKVLKADEKKYDGFALLKFNPSPSLARYCGQANTKVKSAPQFFQQFHSIEADSDRRKPKTDMEDLLSLLSWSAPWNTVEKIAVEVKSVYNFLKNGTSSTCWLEVVYLFLPALLMEKRCKTDREEFSEFVSLCLEKNSNLLEIFNLHKRKLRKSFELLLILHHIANDIIDRKTVREQYIRYAAEWYINMLVLLNKSPESEKKEILEILNDFECASCSWKNESELHNELRNKETALRELLRTYSPPEGEQK